MINHGQKPKKFHLQGIGPNAEMNIALLPA
jgi:hypothetical protein